jgi:hypothetical protein
VSTSSIIIINEILNQDLFPPLVKVPNIHLPAEPGYTSEESEENIDTALESEVILIIPTITLGILSHKILIDE